MTDPTPNDGMNPADGQQPVPPVNPYGTPQQNGQQQYGQQQYGQQPNQYGGAPGGPGGPVPPKKGLPGWAWALIIAGSVLLIGAIAAVVVIFSLVANAVKEEDCSAPGSCGQGLPPSASEEAPVQTEATPDDSGTAGTISIDSSAAFDAPPVWGVPLPTDWEITIFDQEGINQLNNSALGCTFVTSQNAQEIDTSTSSDRSETVNLMQLVRELLAGSATDVTVTSEAYVDLSLQVAGSGSYLEFAMDRVDYTGPGGERFGSVFFGRSMPHSGSYMWTQLDCPSTVLDGPDSPLQDIIDQITVLPQF